MISKSIVKKLAGSDISFGVDRDLTKDLLDRGLSLSAVAGKLVTLKLSNKADEKPTTNTLALLS